VRFGVEMLALFEFTITRGKLVHNSEINANFATGWLQRLSGHVDTANVQPPLGALALHGDRFWFAREWSVIIGLDLANSHEIEPSVLSFQFPSTTIFPLKRVESTGRFESRKPWDLTTLHSAKESSVRSVEPHESASTQGDA
jgi:hypothetical protein